jgi:peroxiredoxin
MKRAFPIILSVAAVAIAAATWWRMSIDDTLPYGRSRTDVLRLPAESFELFDQHRHLVKLERYFSRSAVLLVFFNAESGVIGNEWLDLLRRHHETIESRGVAVVAVTTQELNPAAIHQQTEEQNNSFPFPILSDMIVDNQHDAPVHELYGLYHPETDMSEATTDEATFFISRDGTVTSTVDRPVPIEDPEAFLRDLIEGRPLPE